MLKGAVIMDVVTAEHAKIAQEAGACAVMVLERVPADVRAAGGVARMADPTVIEAIMKAVSIPVMAKCRIGHFNRDFRFNSQSTAMQFSSKKTIGGMAWPSIILSNAEQEKALTLWGNSTLGLLLHWWYVNKQQAGRGRSGVASLTSMPILDVTKLSKDALAKAAAIFDDMKHKELRPVNEIAQDAVRAEIDTRLTTEVLGCPPELASPDGPLALLRQKLALEPSITGAKLAKQNDSNT